MPNLLFLSKIVGLTGAEDGGVLHVNMATISDIGGLKLGCGWRHSKATWQTCSTSFSRAPSSNNLESTRSVIFDLSYNLHACNTYMISISSCADADMKNTWGQGFTYSGRYCISFGRERSVFFLQLMISSTRTPKLYMSAFSDNSPLKAYSGAE